MSAYRTSPVAAVCEPSQRGRHECWSSPPTSRRHEEGGTRKVVCALFDLRALLGGEIGSITVATRSPLSTRREPTTLAGSQPVVGSGNHLTNITGRIHGPHSRGICELWHRHQLRNAQATSRSNAHTVNLDLRKI